MRAVAIQDGRLTPVEVPEPQPAPGEVLVDVVAAGVNRADLAQVAGTYPPPPGASELPGLEVSGYRRDTGEPVVALLAGGGYAQTVAVAPELLLPVPEGLGMVEAAGVVEVCATVVSNLVLEAQLRAGETVLVHGASGGVGTAAVQIAHHLGARVLAVVGSAEAARAVTALGADATIDRHEGPEGILAAAREHGGVDVVLDVVGGSMLTTNVKALRTGGRVVVIGVLGGTRGELPVGLLMTKRARVIGTTLRSRPRDDKHAILIRTRELVWPLVSSGAVTIPVQARFPLEDAAAAHQVLRAGGHLGKVILTID